MSGATDDIVKTWARNLVTKTAKQLESGLFPVEDTIEFDPFDDGLDMHRGGFELIEAAIADCSQYSLPVFLKMLGAWCTDAHARKILHDAFAKIIASDECYKGLHTWGLDDDEWK